VVCWICGKGYDPADPWQADHVLPGNPLSELRGAHRSCNIGRANKARSKRGGKISGDIRGGLYGAL
jgi:rubredoxin